MARKAIDDGWPSDWFDTVYNEAKLDPGRVPWADLEPNPGLVQWALELGLEGAGKRALTVGCGLGDDAEFLEGLGFSVTAFDVSRSAVDWCRRRHPSTRVRYEVADVLEPPAQWRGAFDLVFEAYTLQVLPEAVRRQALVALRGLPAPGGKLLLIARARDPQDPRGELPWPLTRAELDAELLPALQTETFEDYVDDEASPVRRLRALYSRL